MVTQVRQAGTLQILILYNADARSIPYWESETSKGTIFLTEHMMFHGKADSRDFFHAIAGALWAQHRLSLIGTCRNKGQAKRVGSMLTRIGYSIRYADYDTLKSFPQTPEELVEWVKAQPDFAKRLDNLRKYAPDYARLI